ncbi:ABC transporter permease subunit [Ferrimonas sp. YFM]|uniref:ABC transporter permease n=1 Tax=Ferrimonas sp. YFM TaxID=3028878 RepID=UPI002572FA70|nr:ABC transporter permease subunit [Ferrimonas sp. YFM]BDY03688.1 ABC transporter [Ferrimonas sp. YFM]
MSLTHLRLTAVFELRRLFATRRGALWLLAFALVWGLLLRYPILSAADLMRRDDLREFFLSLSPDGLSTLYLWSSPELAVFWVAALVLYPMATIGLAADQMASDLQRGTLRFLTLRVSRDSLLLGRFLGMLAIQLLMILASLAGTLGLALYKGAPLMPVLGQSALVTLNLLLVVLPFTATMALLSLLAKSGRQAVVLATLFWLMTPLAIGLLSMAWQPFEQLLLLIPGGQIKDLMVMTPADALTTSWLPLAQTLVMLALARITLLRSAL